MSSIQSHHQSILQLSANCNKIVCLQLEELEKKIALLKKEEPPRLTNWGALQKKVCSGKCRAPSGNRTVGMIWISFLLYPLNRVLLFRAQNSHQTQQLCFNTVCLFASQASCDLNSMSAQGQFHKQLIVLYVFSPSIPFCLMFSELRSVLSKMIALVYSLQSSLVRYLKRVLRSSYISPRK